MTDLADRYAGCLLGLACGDALGGPVEFQTRGQIAAAYPAGLIDFVGGGWLDLAPGEITDDTQLTLALARALTDDGLDMAIFCRELLAWLHSNPKDIGNTTRRALNELEAGAPWESTGEITAAELGAQRTASNGGVMRCAPVALRFRTDPETLVAASLASARVTHGEQRAAWAAVAVNQAIVHLLADGSIADAPEAAAAGIEPLAVRDAVLGAAGLAPETIRGRGFVIDTLQTAFYTLAHGDSAEDVIVRAVAVGDDTDTSAAVAGALAGAAYGARALPERWLSLLQPRPELEEHAARLLSISEAPGQVR